ADGSRSDKAELLAHALTETRAEAAIMLGDRRYDIEGARLNGLPAIGALWGYGELDELREVDADALAAVPEEVADLVVELMGLSE
ncbi:MAG: HAD hydrolase-like protein, partial [Pseudomonadota bacterium]